ncbi:MAG: TonB family protein [Longimicrobiaceae bacterium]
MIGWMLFAAAVSMLAGVAAAGAERGLRLAHLPARWAWAAALAASLVLPLALPGRPPSSGVPAGAAAAGSAAVPGTPAPARTPAPPPAPGEDAVGALVRGAEPVLPWAWGASTLLVGLGMAGSALRVARLRRRWTAATVAGERVLVSDAVGPAVAGVVRPRIVLPRWTLAWAEPLQRMIVRHEREHVQAGDPALLLAGLCAAALMPWNVAVWWQLGRLRLAVEVDCDARTLRGGGDVGTYGRLLIEVGRRATAPRVALAAFSEPRSSLEWRIRAMTDRIPRGRAPRLFGWAALGAAAVVSIAALPAPPGPLQLRGAAPAAADTSMPVLLNGDVVRRELEAAYPPMLRAAGITGTAVLRFRIDASGTPADAVVVRASHPALAEAALRVLPHSRWSVPRGASGTLTVPFAFQLAEGDGAVATVPLAAPRDEPSGVLRLAEVDRQPELLDREATQRLLQQDYPPLLRAAGIQGRVVVSMVVGADGRAHAAAIISAAHDAFREPALAAVAAMRFRPAQKDGRAVPVRLSLPIEFRLSTADFVAR